MTEKRRMAEESVALTPEVLPLSVVATPPAPPISVSKPLETTTTSYVNYLLIALIIGMLLALAFIIINALLQREHGGIIPDYLVAYRNMGVVGNSIASTTSVTSSVACQKLCEADTACNAAVWNIPLKTCALYDASSTATLNLAPQSNVWSFVLNSAFPQETSLLRFGGTTAQPLTTTNNPTYAYYVASIDDASTDTTSCETACVAQKGCVAAEYTSGNCYTYSFAPNGNSSPEVLPLAATASGTVSVRANQLSAMAKRVFVYEPGQNISTTPGISFQASNTACRSTCAQTPTCVGYTLTTGAGGVETCDALYLSTSSVGGRVTLVPLPGSIAWVDASRVPK